MREVAESLAHALYACTAQQACKNFKSKLLLGQVSEAAAEALGRQCSRLHALGHPGEADPAAEERATSAREVLAGLLEAQGVAAHSEAARQALQNVLQRGVDTQESQQIQAGWTALEEADAALAGRSGPVPPARLAEALYLLDLLIDARAHAREHLFCS